MCDSHTVTGRVKKPLSKKLNPVWWWKNDDDPNPPDWFAGSKLAWWIRNPFHNLTFYVVGVADRNYTVYGKAPAGLSVRADLDEFGWQWSVILAGGILPLPWLSYTGRRVTWYMGWQPTGKLGFKFVVHRS